MKYKKAFYFTLDAFLAVAILAVGFILIISSFASKPSKVQTRHISDDLLNVLATVKWSELDNSHYFALFSGPPPTYTPQNPDLTVLEVIGESYFRSNGAPDSRTTTDAGNIITEILISKNLIPPQFSYEFVLIDNERSPTPPDNQEVQILCEPSGSCEDSKNQASFLTSSKKFVFGTYLDGTDLKVWGPYIIEARVWRK